MLEHFENVGGEGGGEKYSVWLLRKVLFNSPGTHVRRLQSLELKF